MNTWTRSLLHKAADMLAGALIVIAVWILPERIEKFFASEPISIQASPYLTAPGNRFRCPETLADGRRYEGWIMYQSDSNQALWKLGGCYYGRRI